MKTGIFYLEHTLSNLRKSRKAEQKKARIYKSSTLFKYKHINKANSLQGRILENEKELYYLLSQIETQNISDNESQKEICDHKWNAVNQCYSRCEKCGVMIRDD